MADWRNDRDHDDGPAVEVRLLGTPRFRCRGVDTPFPRKAFVLIAVLAVARGATTSRSRLRSILWGQARQAAASTNLRQLISRVSRIERALGVRILEHEGDVIRIAAPDVRIDVTALQPPALRPGTSDPETLWAAVKCWSGELLGDLPTGDEVLEEWLLRERSVLKSAFVTAAVALLQSGHTTPADDLDIANRLLAAEPTNEAGYRARIRAFGLRGDLSRSRMTFLECERVLRSELDIPPSPETVDLASRYFDIGSVTRLPDDHGRAVQADPATMAPSVHPTRDERPRIAILPPSDPFDNRRLRVLCNHMLEDIVIGLARFRSFRIIAAHTSVSVSTGIAHRSPMRDWCDYVLASALSRRAEDYELKYRLTDAHSGEVVWASSVMIDRTDLAGLFRSLADRAVAALADAVERREVARPTPPNDPRAYRHYLHARAYIATMELPLLRRARRMMREARRGDPGFAAYSAGIARTMTLEWLVRGAPDPRMLEDALRHADEAIAADDRDARGHREKGLALLYLKRHDESLAVFSEAAQLNPNDADLLADYADALAHSGDPESGLAVFERALALNPSPPVIYRWVQAGIHYQMKRYRDVLTVLEPWRHETVVARLLAAAHAQTGDIRAAQAPLRLVRQSLPDFRTDQLWVIVPNRHEEDTRHLIEGLRKAGLA
jgi:DNA-binding SARP family transcriptional activator/tetratricopeptide (TPR) repeat protein